MKTLICFAIFSLIALAGLAQQKTGIHQVDSTKKVQQVEASCGQCKFGLKGKGCSLAVRIDGKAYFVDGTSIDEHGDAHAADGFCESIRKANVQGDIVNNRFQATYFKLQPLAVKKKG